MRSLLKIFAIALTLIMTGGGLPAESRAAQATLGCPGTVQAGQQFTVEVTIDVGTRPLGAYTITVDHDPTVLAVASVAGGSAAEFSGAPTTNTTAPGTTNVAAFQSASLTSPTGVVSLVLITFDVVATASTTVSIGLTVDHLFDTNAAPIVPATGTGCSVPVSGPPPTTTTSSTTTTTRPPATSTTVQPATTTTVIQPTTNTNGVTTISTPTTIVLPFLTTTTLPRCFRAPESIASNFNGTSIAKNAFIWFNGVLSVHGPHPGDFTVRCDDSTIDFVAGGERYVLAVPSASVAFSSAATVATTEFNAASNEWETVIPSSAPAGNAFLTGLGFQVPVDFPGGIKPVTWTCRFSSDAPGVMVSWKWSAAVYTDFSTDPDALGVKPVDGRRSAHGNADHAGTPETFRASVIGGARGGGGSNFTGGYSSTRAGKCPLCQDDHVPPALNRRIRKARMLSARVARAGSGGQAEKLQTRLARSLGGIGRLISRAEAAGRISPSCARVLQGIVVVDARVRAERGATNAHPRAAP